MRDISPLSIGDTLEATPSISTTLRRTQTPMVKPFYAGNAPRTLPFKLPRLLRMDHNPELSQTLPARELHELVTGDQYSAVFAELERLPDSDMPSRSTARSRKTSLN